MHVGAGAHDDSDGDERVPNHGSDDDSNIGSGPSPIDDVHVHRLVVFEGDLFPKAAVDRVPPLTGAAVRARARSVLLATPQKKWAWYVISVQAGARAVRQPWYLKRPKVALQDSAARVMFTAVYGGYRCRGDCCVAQFDSTHAETSFASTAAAQAHSATEWIAIV